MSENSTTVTFACPPDCEAVGVVTTHLAPLTSSSTETFIVPAPPPETFDKPIAIKTTNKTLPPNTNNIDLQFSILFWPNLLPRLHIDYFDRRSGTALRRQQFFGIDIPVLIDDVRLVSVI